MEIRSILVPIDGSELSLKAADEAAELARHLNAEITLFTVVEPPEVAATYVSREALEAVCQGLWRAGEAMLDQAARRIRPRHSRVEKRIVRGTPATAIAAEADASHQLVVMGSRGLGMAHADRQMLGSVAERVLRRTRCPVLIVPEHAESEPGP
jgi:nucleotide-binding universal stress UspA family protein